MISDDRFGLRPLWDAMLAIYSEVAKICDRHGLRYYATDGTALGAIRHKGFIPWDDDFDISMPRPDYEKFLELAKTELPENLKIVNNDNTPEFKLIFAKVQEVREPYVKQIENKLGYELSNGIFIDVFPIEGYPCGFRRIFINLIISILARAIIWGNQNHSSMTIKNLVKTLYVKIVRLIIPGCQDWQDCIHTMERLVRSTDFETSEFTSRTCSQLKLTRRSPLPRKVWGKARILEFDNITIPVPENVDSYLRNEFNKYDYRELPPVEEQHPTHSYSSRCPWWLGPTER